MIGAGDLLTLALNGLLITMTLAVLTWLLSLAYQDVSIVDRVWSLLILSAGLVYLAGVMLDTPTPLIAMTAATTALAPPSASGLMSHPRGMLAIGLALIWALRLAAHITWRSWGHPEDRRYQDIRRRNQPNYPIKSLYLVFLLQAALAWIVSWTLLGAVLNPSPLTYLDGLGAALSLFGITFEAVADWQLLRFTARARGDDGSVRPTGSSTGAAAAKPAQKSDSVLDTGLWAYSRHPNYFGEFCTWWGLFLIACSAGAWWAVLSPLLMSVLLLKVSGVTLNEQGMNERRPKYRHYAATVNTFFPGPRRQQPSRAADGL